MGRFLLLGFGFMGLVFAQIRPEFLEAAKERNVLIVGHPWRQPGIFSRELFRKGQEMRMSSGVILSGAYVLSAGHIVKGVRSLSVAGAPAILIKLDLAVDLALFSADVAPSKLPAAALGDAAWKDPVFVVANPLGLTGKVSYGVMLGTEPGSFFKKSIECDLALADTISLPGSSGGGYWSAVDGRLVGIVAGLQGMNATSVLVPAAQIKKFLADTPLAGLFK